MSCLAEAQIWNSVVRKDFVLGDTTSFSLEDKFVIYANGAVDRGH